jgi:hypothetical protein
MRSFVFFGLDAGTERDQVTIVLIWVTSTQGKRSSPAAVPSFLFLDKIADALLTSLWFSAAGLSFRNRIPFRQIWPLLPLPLPRRSLRGTS